MRHDNDIEKHVEEVRERVNQMKIGDKILRNYLILIHVKMGESKK